MSINGPSDAELGLVVGEKVAVRPPHNRIDALRQKSRSSHTGKEQLDRSDFFRHKRSYEAIAELARSREEVRCLVIGPGTLEEPLGYIATYYHSTGGSLSGLEIKLIDIRTEREFQDLAQTDDPYSLGRNLTGQPRIPPSCTTLAFGRTASEEYVVKTSIKEKLVESVGSGSYETSIASEVEMRQAGVIGKQYDFVSCNNVLQYVEIDEFEHTLVRVLDLVEEGGITSLRTDELDARISRYIKEHRDDFEVLKRGLYKKKKSGG